MMLFDTWFPGNLVFWGAIVLIVFFSSYFRYRTRESRHRMLEKLAEKGQTVSTDLLGRIDEGKPD